MITTDVLNSEKHRAKSLEVAKESFVLLKNEKNTLPLDVGSIKNIALIGPATNDTYRLVGNYYGCATSAWGDLDP